MDPESQKIVEFLETPAAKRLLTSLADGRTHACHALAAVMQCQSDAVAPAIALLRSAGLDLQGESMAEVRLAGSLELLDANKIVEASGLAADYLNSVDVSLGLASTNDTLLERAREGAASGTVCLAEWQGAGRGRQSRGWVSPLASSIYFSLLWRFGSRPPKSSLGLTVGAVLARCLTGMELCDVSLKWPNDLQWRDRKLGGILIDGGGTAPSSHYVVIGIGINHRLPAWVQRDIDRPVVGLFEAMGLRCPPRNEVIGRLLSELVPTLSALEKGEHTGWRRDWEHYDCCLGQGLRVALPGGKEIRGIGVGLREDGALLVDDGSLVHAVLAGDVSVRVDR